jgi:hypothetical protein
MRVYVEHDMTVNHNTNVVTLKAGEIVEGPLAVYLVESDCDVTIESDDRLAAVPEEAPVEQAPVETGASTEESHTPGGEQPEGTEATAEPGAAE